MKREDLKKLGLEDDQVEQVMTLHGKTLNPLNEELEELEKTKSNLESQIKKHDSNLEDLRKNNSSNEELKNTIKTLQKENQDNLEKYQNEIESFKKETALNTLISNSNGRNPKAINALLDHDKIEFKDGELVGAKEQLEELKKNDSYLFNMGESTGGYEPNGGEPPKLYSSLEEAMKEGDDAVEQYFQSKIESEE